MLSSMINLLSSITQTIHIFFRCFLKGFLRRCTGLCELQRICYADNLGTARTKAVEYSISMSQEPTIQRIHKRLNDLADDDDFSNHWEDVEEALDKVMHVKKIDPKIHES